MIKKKIEKNKKLNKRLINSMMGGNMSRRVG